MAYDNGQQEILYTIQEFTVILFENDCYYKTLFGMTSGEAYDLAIKLAQEYLKTHKRTDVDFTISCKAFIELKKELIIDGLYK